MNVFPLPNRESHHLALWLVRHAGRDLDRLIHDAFDLAITHDVDQLDVFDDYHAVAFELSELLRAWFTRRSAFLERCRAEHAQFSRGVLGPLLQLSIDRLDFDAVAEAVLKLLGKFAPADAAAYPYRTIDEEADTVED